jgi:hypothetical protein
VHAFEVLDDQRCGISSPTPKIFDSIDQLLRTDFELANAGDAAKPPYVLLPIQKAIPV